MSDQAIETRKPFQNLEGSNSKQKEIARLRNVALDPQESPTERLAAATRLLSRYGPSKRNVVVINSVLKIFVSGHEYSITERARKLKAKLMKAKGLKATVDSELPDEKQEVTDAPPVEIIGGTSASEVPRTSLLSIDGIRDVIRKVIGVLPYQATPQDLSTLSIMQQNLVIEAIVWGCGMSLSPSEIETVIGDMERKELGSHFPGLLQVARRYLAVTTHLLEQLNQKDFSGASQ